MQLKEDFILDLITDIANVESLELPGPAKHGWVIAEQLRKHAASPSPVWIWLLIELLQAIIPKLVEWLKKKYGPMWLDKLLPDLQNKAITWPS